MTEIECIKYYTDKKFRYDNLNDTSSGCIGLYTKPINGQEIGILTESSLGDPVEDKIIKGFIVYKYNEINTVKEIQKIKIKTRVDLEHIFNTMGFTNDRLEARMQILQKAMGITLMHTDNPVYKASIEDKYNSLISEFERQNWRLY